jgi:hypothetical protein
VPARKWSTAAAYVTALAVVAAGAWSAFTATADGPLSVPGGTVYVEQVHTAAPSRHAMPGMGTDDDPVPGGRRRITVDVTLVAGKETLDYSVRGFRLDIGGEQLEPHRAVLPGTAVPAGTQLSGSLVFDVPADATDGVLTLSGQREGTVVTLPQAADGHSAHAS